MRSRVRPTKMATALLSLATCCVVTLAAATMAATLEARPRSATDPLVEPERPAWLAPADARGATGSGTPGGSVPGGTPAGIA